MKSNWSYFDQNQSCVLNLKNNIYLNNHGLRHDQKQTFEFFD